MFGLQEIHKYNLRVLIEPLVKTLIRNIRTESYSGLLIYCSIFYPIETQKIGFWDGLDFIG
ncbi:unnamed protein product, partial [Adineta steineri]